MTANSCLMFGIFTLGVVCFVDTEEGLETGLMPGLSLVEEFDVGASLQGKGFSLKTRKESNN